MRNPVGAKYGCVDQDKRLILSLTRRECDDATRNDQADKIFNHVNLKRTDLAWQRNVRASDRPGQCRGVTGQWACLTVAYVR